VQENKEVQTKVNLSQALELQRKRVKEDDNVVISSTVFTCNTNKVLPFYKEYFIVKILEICYNIICRNLLLYITMRFYEMH
jgi:hypothetical protein